MSGDGEGQITVLLRQMRGGDRAAADVVVPLLFRELRELARIYLRREADGHTLQC